MISAREVLSLGFGYVALISIKGKLGMFYVDKIIFCYAIYIVRRYSSIFLPEKLSPVSNRRTQLQSFHQDLASS